MEKFDKKAIDAKVAAGFPLTDRWHNRFHLEMPFGLINDPNGMTFANGEYTSSTSGTLWAASTRTSAGHT